MVKIAVVMFYTEDYSIGKHANQFNKIYCDKNNYDLFVYHDIPEQLKKPIRHSSWCKHYYLNKHLENNKHDYVMWIDADAFFCNTSIKIEHWINQSENKDYIICRDAGYPYTNSMVDLKGKNTLPLLNSGVIIMKNTENNKKILNHILYDKLYEGNYPIKRSRNIQTNMTGWDQAAVRHTYLKNIHNMKENTHIIVDTNFNNNCLNVEEYVNQGGYIIHMTNFKCKFQKKDSKNIINSYKELYLSNL